MLRKISNSKIDKLIYLDSEFISSKFEEIKGISPVTQMTKVEGIRGQFGVGLLSSGVHTQETRTFKVSSFQMWLKIESELMQYPDFKVDNFVNNKGTFVRWIKGNLSLGTWRESDKPDNSYEYFELYFNNHKVALLTQQEYLTAGFNSILTASSALKSNIRIPVKVLARILWYAESSFYVACPYIILES